MIHREKLSCQARYRDLFFEPVPYDSTCGLVYVFGAGEMTYSLGEGGDILRDVNDFSVAIVCEQVGCAVEFSGYDGLIGGQCFEDETAGRVVERRKDGDVADGQSGLDFSERTEEKDFSLDVEFLRKPFVLFWICCACDDEVCRSFG